MRQQDVRARSRFVTDQGREAIVLMVATWQPKAGDRFRVSVIEPGGEYERERFETEADALACHGRKCEDLRARGYDLR